MVLLESFVVLVVVVGQHSKSIPSCCKLGKIKLLLIRSLATTTLHELLIRDQQMEGERERVTERTEQRTIVGVYSFAMNMKMNFIRVPIVH